MATDNTSSDAFMSEESKRALALRDEIEKNQLAFLDESAKRIVDLVTVLLGVLFSIIAFGDKFPPAYLSANNVNKALAIAALVLYVIALAACLYAQSPRAFPRYENNVTAQKEAIDNVVADKAKWYRVGAISFGLASAFLAGFIIYLISQA